MPEVHTLKNAQENLSKEVDRIIQESTELSKKSKKPIADGYVKGQTPVAELFDRTPIDLRIMKSINDAILASGLSNRFKPPIGEHCDNIYLGELLRKTKTVNKAKEVILCTITYLKNKRFFNEQKATVFNEKINYLTNLYFHLSCIKNLIKSSKKIKKRDFVAPTEFCVLCWRLVNKAEFVSLSSPEVYQVNPVKGKITNPKGYSNYYCFEHHPKIRNSKYHYARAALTYAIKVLNINTVDIIDPLVFYAATSRCVQKTNPLDHKETSNAVKLGGRETWHNRAYLIKEMSRLHYPNAYHAIEKIVIENQVSWIGWFHSIIDSLDSHNSTLLKKDLFNWKSSGVDIKEMSNKDAIASDYIGEDVLISILHRFECVCKINEIYIENKTNRPRGPKKGSVKKNDMLRLKIINIVNKQLEESTHINGAQIARDLGISRERVSKLLKEMSIR